MWDWPVVPFTSLPSAFKWIKLPLGVDGNSIDNITLYYTDDSEYVVKNEANFVSNHTYELLEMERDIMNYILNRIVDTNSIASVEINGVMYE